MRLLDVIALELSYGTLLLHPMARTTVPVARQIGELGSKDSRHSWFGRLRAATVKKSDANRSFKKRRVWEDIVCRKLREPNEMFATLLCDRVKALV